MTAIQPPDHPYVQNELNSLDFCECGVAKRLHEYSADKRVEEIVKKLKSYNLLNSPHPNQDDDEVARSILTQHHQDPYKGTTGSVSDVKFGVPKPPRWRAKQNHLYLYVTDGGEIVTNYDYNRTIDNFRYNTGNYFQTEAEAIAHRTALLEQFK